MRNIVALSLLVVIAYWLDLRYNNGVYRRSIADMVQHIVVSFK